MIKNYFYISFKLSIATYKSNSSNSSNSSNKMATTAKVELSSITHGILIIRIERLLDYINDGNLEAAVRMCKIYSEELEKKAGPLFERETAINIADTLFEIELLLMLNASDLAKSKIHNIRDQITKPLVNYAMFRNRLMDDTSSKDSIGTLAMLPQDILRNVVDALQVEYCW